MPMNRDDDRRAAAGGVDAFQQLVDAFGSVSSRWPAKRREEAEVLLRSNTPAGAAARGILAEARALDRVLASPMPINPARVASPRASNVVPLTSAMGKGSPALGARSRVPRTGWAAGALLAASLLLGISIGPAITTMPAFHDVADFVGLSHIGDQLALTGAEDGSLHDEDVL
jgi:hypothetical protein